jgi:hypothetical protein
MIVEKFRIHLHQHPAIPFDDAAGTYFTATEIHEGAVRDMYQVYFNNDLSQVWAYLWNRWYNPAQWKLWARSANLAIPRIKTTMIVESLWKHIKHRDLAHFNQPRLDLVTHIVIENVLPRALRTLSYVHGLRRAGRPQALTGWQTDMKADWIGMSRCDTEWSIRRQLEWLKKPKTTKGQAERLAELEEEEHRPQGVYVTSVQQWTCSCPAYLISRFLLCKHLVRIVNTTLPDDPRTNLQFFLNLQWQHYPPYYLIPGIHENASENIEQVEDEDNMVHVVGHGMRSEVVEEEHETTNQSQDEEELAEPQRVSPPYCRGTMALLPWVSQLTCCTALTPNLDILLTSSVGSVEKAI